MTRRPCTTSLTGAASLLALALALPAHAQSDAELTSARELAVQGIEAYDADRWGEAAELLGRAFEVAKVPSVGLHLARALARQGRLVEAVAIYSETAILPVTFGNPEEQEAAKTSAQEEVTELLRRVPRLVVRVEGEAIDGAQVLVDGEPVSLLLLASGHLVDPGEHVIVASADERRAEARVTAEEGQAVATTLELGPVTERLPLEAETPEEPGPSAGEPAVPADTPSRGARGRRVAGWIFVGAGGAALAWGAGEAAAASSKRSELDESGCVDGSCPPALDGEVASYNQARTLSSVGFVLGATLATTGVVLLALPARRDGAALGSVRLRFAGPWLGLEAPLR